MKQITSPEHMTRECFLFLWPVGYVEVPLPFLRFSLKSKVGLGRNLVDSDITLDIVFNWEVGYFSKFFCNVTSNRRFVGSC